jgi:hypothetical protein
MGDLLHDSLGKAPEISPGVCAGVLEGEEGERPQEREALADGRVLEMSLAATLDLSLPLAFAVAAALFQQVGGDTHL